MDTKIKTIIYLGIITGLFSIFTSLLATSAAQPIYEPEEKPSISIVGSAEKEISADESKISLAVENTNTNPNTARKINADNMNSIINALKKTGLTEANITTSNYEITPNYDNKNNQNDKIISYTAINKIDLNTTVNANISKFIDIAVANGANRVENINFVTSKKILDETSLILLKEAFKNAKVKAETLAIEGNFNISGVKKIDVNLDNPINSPSYLYDNAVSSEKSSSPSTQIIPQKNIITTTLSVDFYIKN